MSVYVTKMRSIYCESSVNIKITGIDFVSAHSHLPNADNCTHVTHWLFDKGHTRATFNDYTAPGLDRALPPDPGPDAGQTL